MWSLTPSNLQARDGKGKCWAKGPMGRIITTVLHVCTTILYQPRCEELCQHGRLQISRRSYLWDFRKGGFTWRKVKKDENYMLLTYA